MPLADTGKAIGKVTELLSQHLDLETGFTVSVGRPEPPGNGTPQPGARLNLFLYEAVFDPSLRNVALDEGQPEPLWLVLHYLITAFDDTGNSDTIQALENLGEGIRSLQKLSYLSLDGVTLPADILAALEDNPEILKITFDETNSDLLSRLMQGSDEKYRFSMGFQVRPVMIAQDTPPSFALLVGVDHTTVPATIIGEDGIQIPVLPSMGPALTGVEPLTFEVNDTIVISGNDLSAAGLSIELGGQLLTIDAQRADSVTCTVNGAIAGGTTISAGSMPLMARELLITGRTRRSNIIAANLRPTVATASLVPATIHEVNPPPPGVPSPPFPVAGSIELTGALLGTEDDDVTLALYRDGAVVQAFDTAYTYAPDQTTLTLAMPDTQAVPPGEYRVILRVNGQQARTSPALTLSV